MTLATALGYIAGTCTTASLLPQVLKAWRSRSVEDLSLAMLLIFAGGVALWVVYGLLLGETPIVLFNALSFALAQILIYFKIAAMRRKH